MPRADAGADLVLRAGEAATLGGPGTGGGPWGTNVEYAWVEVDAEGNPVADAARAEGLSAADVARPGFTAPALAAERVLRYRFTVTGKGAASTGAVNRHRASDTVTVTVTVRAAPAVTAVALTSVPRADGEYRRGETIEIGVTFSTPVTVTGKPTIGLEVGTQVRRAAYARHAAPGVLVFGYEVADGDTDDNGVAVPADGLRLAGGTIADAEGGAAMLGHDAVAADAAHGVNGSRGAPTGGVCERTPQVRAALVAAVQENDPEVEDCSQVGDDELAGIAGHAAAERSGHRGAEAWGLGRPERSDDPLAEWQRAERAAGGGVRRVGRGGDSEPAVQRPRRGKSRGRGVRAADRAVTARPEQQPRQRELRAEGGRRRGPGAARGRECDAGRPGHGPGSVGHKCRLPMGRGRRRGHPGGGWGPHGGPLGGGRGAAGL